MRIIPFLWLALPGAAFAQTLQVDEVLIRSVPRVARPEMQVDPVERDVIRGTWSPPGAEGDGWVLASADDDGWIGHDGLTQGYAAATVTVDRAGVWILDAMGYAGVTVNGEPRVGNIYGYTDTWESWQPHFDFSRLPVRLRAGENHFLFFGNRYGLLRARLEPADAAQLLNADDATLPDLVVGEAVDTWGALVVLNPREQFATDITLTVRLADGPAVTVQAPPVPPLGVRKVAFPIRGPAADTLGSVALRVEMSRPGARSQAVDLELAVKNPGDNRRVTFRSQIDDSVQYYGYLAATGRPGPKALVLSLHGASVEAINQSGSYGALSWGHILAPTNRRPFGFDWERWGRLDALEVLRLGSDALDIDADRIYLTGHSMGGHGTWHLGTLHPDRFAAIGPSAGWISYWSYRRDPPPASDHPLVPILERGLLPSRTLEMAPNLDGVGVYVLHGGVDDNVPPEQSHLMLERLKEFHRDTTYHEEPDQGHWWDLSDEPGADCVAWAPLFDFLARHRRPRVEEVRRVRFQTPNPAVSAWRHWAGIGQQQRPLALSSIDLQLDPGRRRVHGSTHNVARLGLALSHLGPGPVEVELDGITVEAPLPPDGPLWLQSRPGWSLSSPPDPAHKGERRSGGFWEVMGNRVQFVVGTRGTAEENALALAKARYDAEFLWYKGNASVDVIHDDSFDPAAEPDRNVVLYGNAQTHADWAALWTGDVSVERGKAAFGDRSVDGTGVGVLAVRPRPGSAVAAVGIVASTGAAGSRLLMRRPYLESYVAYPDVTFFQDHADGNVVLMAGFFGPDWSVATGEFVWADE